MNAVESALSRCGIQRQAYFGGAFIGNHVHKALRVSLINSLFSSQPTSNCRKRIYTGFANQSECHLVKEKNSNVTLTLWQQNLQQLSASSEVATTSTVFRENYQRKKLKSLARNQHSN